MFLTTKREDYYGIHSYRYFKYNRWTHNLVGNKNWLHQRIQPNNESPISNISIFIFHC
jgi:hypothetical protein